MSDVICESVLIRVVAGRRVAQAVRAAALVDEVLLAPERMARRCGLAAPARREERRRVLEPVDEEVVVRRRRAEDSDTGSGQVDAVRADVREACSPVVLIRGRDADDPRRVVVAGVLRERVVVVADAVRAAVPGCEDEQRVRALRRVDRSERRGGGPAAAEAAVHHAGAVRAGVVDRADDRAVREAPAGVACAQRHDRHLPVDAGDAERVVAARADRPGDVRPVVVRVERDVVALEEVPAVRVVDLAVGVVVDVVARVVVVRPDVLRRDPGGRRRPRCRSRRR